MTKVCRCCEKELPLSEYYNHVGMADGHLNICKECVKNRVNNHRQNNIEKTREYDRLRSNLPHRKKLRYEITKRRRKEVGYESAHLRVLKAISKGIIDRPTICQCCGSKEVRIEAHHYDYAKPLEIIWLCKICHAAYHAGKTKVATEIRKKVNTLVGGS